MQILGVVHVSSVHPTLAPVGLTDISYEKSVKLYCGRCEDLYSPKSSQHGSIDCAYFGTTFPHLLFLVYPTLLPSKDPESTIHLLPSKDALAGNPRNRRWLREEPEAVAEGGGEGVSTATVALKAERYRPRIYGFQINEIARLQCWQELSGIGKLFLTRKVFHCSSYLPKPSRTSGNFGGQECLDFVFIEQTNIKVYYVVIRLCDIRRSPTHPFKQLMGLRAFWDARVCRASTKSAAWTCLGGRTSGVPMFKTMGSRFRNLSKVTRFWFSQRTTWLSLDLIPA